MIAFRIEEQWYDFVQLFNQEAEQDSFLERKSYHIFSLMFICL